MNELLEEKLSSLRYLLNEKLRDIRENIRKRKVILAAAVLKDYVVMARVRDRKFLQKKTYPLKGENRVKSLSAIWKRAEKDGLIGEELSLLVLSPSLRMEMKRLPDMMEAEVKEAMYWEADRIFRTMEPLYMAYQVMNHTPEGYDVVTAAVKEKDLKEILESIRLAGKRIGKLVIPWETLARKFEGQPLILLAGGKNTGTLCAGDGKGRFASRVIRKSEETEKEIQGFLSRWERFLPEGKRHVKWIPLYDGTEMGDFWKKTVRFRKSETMAQTFAGEEEILEMLAMVPECRMEMAGTGEGFPLSGESLLKRLDTKYALYGGAAILSLSVMISVNSYLGLRKAEGDYAALKEKRAAYASYVEKEKMEKDAAAGIKKTVEAGEGWQGKLIALSEAARDRVVIKELTNERGAVRLTGSSLSEDEVRTFSEILGSAWHYHVRMESVKKEKNVPLYTFILNAEKGTKEGDVSRETNPS